MWPFGLEPGKQPRRSASTIESGEALASLQTAAELVGLGWSYWRPGSKDVESDDRLRAIWGLSPGAPLDLQRATAAVHPNDRHKVEEISFAIGKHKLQGRVWC
jgi:hypothetical protein